MLVSVPFSFLLPILVSASRPRFYFMFSFLLHVLPPASRSRDATRASFYSHARFRPRFYFLPPFHRPFPLHPQDLYETPHEIPFLNTSQPPLE